MIELMVVVAIIGAVAALATASLVRARPRANLTGAAVDLQSLLHAARQTALATGEDVAVMFFPAFDGPGDQVGRVVVYRDGERTFFDETAAVNFDDYQPGALAAGPRSEVVTTLDLPPAVRFGPADGQGAGAVLPAPWSTIPVNLDCTFCDGEKEARRGAVVFDSSGRATFHAKTGVALAVEGGSVSLEVPALETDGRRQIRTLAVGASTGAVRAINNG